MRTTTLKSGIKFSNLYNFIRLVLGNDISDRQIAQRWGFDEKNFHEFKTGKYPVPRLAKLESLSSILDVNKHLIFQVAGGTPARKVYDLIKRNDLAGQIRLLSSQLNEANKALSQSEKRYRELFNNANDAIIIADTQTAVIINCNKQAEYLLGRPKNEILGMHQTQLHPPIKREYYKNLFGEHIRLGKINELKKQKVVKKDGSIVPVYISSSVIALDGRKVIQGIFREAGNGKNKQKR